MRDPEPDHGQQGPEHASDIRREASPSAPAGRAAAALRRPERRGEEGHRGFVQWVRAQPVLAGALVGFCILALVGLVVSAPRGLWSTGRAGGARVATPAPLAPVARPEAPDAGLGSPVGAARGGESAEAGPWVEAAVPPASPRGVALVYRYRMLPPGGESRYEWIVQVRGAQRVLEGIDVVNWRMEPAAKNGEEFISRDRAADGFPLFGHGPGGWFGVSATIHYQDGGEETLARRIELSE